MSTLRWGSPSFCYQQWQYIREDRLTGIAAIEFGVDPVLTGEGIFARNGERQRCELARLDDEQRQHAILDLDEA